MASGFWPFHGAIFVAGAIEIADGREVGRNGRGSGEPPCFFGHGVGEEGSWVADRGEIVIMH